MQLPCLTNKSRSRWCKNLSQAIREIAHVPIIVTVEGILVDDAQLIANLVVLTHSATRPTSLRRC